MKPRSNTLLIASLALLACTGGCGSAPDRGGATIAPHRFDPAADPYWLDPAWAKGVLDATQAVVRDPVAATDMATSGPHVTIKFTYAEGAIEDPAIIAGTGDPALDALLLKQVVTAQVPKPAGQHIGEPHAFLLDLDMLTPFESFQDSVYAAIDRYKLYPREAIIAGNIGAATLGLDYLDGKATNIAITKSSMSQYLDGASVQAATRATMPPAPPAYAGKPLHMEVIVCYAMNNSKNCPASRNVILVLATRIKTVMVETYRP